MTDEKNKGLRDGEYVALAEFRYQLRKFSRHMEGQVRKVGVNPQQYQVILALRGLPPEQAPTVGRLAERMQLNHNSMVELVDRCEDAGLLRRMRSRADRRQVTLTITGQGETLLRKLGRAAREELLSSGPALITAVQRLIKGARPVQGSRHKERRKGVSRKAGR
jgi:DNA-binding MarR family transcriptional regulator